MVRRLVRVGLTLSLLACLLLPGAALAHDSSSAAPEKSAFVGEQRLLFIPVTWGPEPYTPDDVRRVVFGETAAWISEASFGASWLTGDVTPWLHALERPLRSCALSTVKSAALAAAAKAGYDPARYNRFGFLFPAVPRSVCRFSGLADDTDTYYNGLVTRKLVAHELGHTYGLGHANTWECGGGTCTPVEYGDPYDTMGSGSGHFNAFEKFQIGWVRNVARAEAPGTFLIDRLDRPSTGAQALVIRSARSEYWLDLRLEQLSFAAAFLPTGVEIRAGPNLAADPAMLVYSDDNLLLPNPIGAGRAAVFPGETFREAGSFEVTVVSQTGDQAALRFDWIDRTAPKPPRIVDPQPKLRPGGTLEVTWQDAAELGSGVAYYEVVLNAGKAVRVPVDFRISALARFRKPGLGTHVVRVVAVDRAGNRSAAAVRRFTVAKPAKAKR